MIMKKNIIIGTSLAIFAGLTVSVAVATASHGGLSLLFANDSPYSLSLDNEHAITGSSGFVSVRTADGNYIDFSYSNASSSSGNFGKLRKSGYLLNAYDDGKTYKNALGTLKSITVTFDGDLSLEYSWGREIYFDDYLSEEVSLTSGVAFNFKNEEPNYFKIKANSETTITSVSLSYSCGTNNEYPESYGIITVKNESELKALRDAVNGGDSYAGKTIYVVNDISLTQSDFGSPIGTGSNMVFSGTFNGLGYTISNLTKTTGNTIGLFSKLTNGTVKNLKLANVSMTGNGNRVSALAGRVVDSTIENVEVTSGSISGTTQNGGLVGVIVAGSNKTVIKNCINRASVNATSGGGNGGIVGHNYSGVTEIINCLNYGNVTSTASNTTGGIFGSRNTGTVTISHCYNSASAVIKNANVTASTIGGASAGYIHSSSSSSTDSYVGLFDTAISSASELRTFLSNSNNGVVVLEDNIDLNDVVNNDETDYSRASTFTGTFDGLGNKISHFKTNAETASLFKGVTGGTVTNLNMEHVYVVSTTQRGASVVSRMESSLVSEITASGVINGVTQNGGIIAAITGTNTINGCTNYVDVTSTKTSTGGVVACCVSTGTAFEMFDCVNYGTIKGSGIVTGGIMGGTNSNGTGKNYIHDCTNYGNISGTQYTGGVIGIARENSHEESLIERCTNYGNVTGSSTVSAGGIVGLTRFDVSNCQCYENVTISLNGVSDFAKNLSAVGGEVSGTAGGGNHRGYIAGTTGNGADAAGSLTNGISDYTESVANGSTSLSQAYGRIEMLGNGKSILTLANRFSISDTKGIGNYTKLVNRDTSTSSGGFGYEYVPGHDGDEDYKLWLANMEPLCLPDGRLFIFYRTDTKLAAEGAYYSSIRAIESRDYGQTWLNTRHIIFENYATTNKGAYEPFAILDGNTLQIYIAFDAPTTRAGGLGPNNSSFICSNNYQNILRIPVNISNMGFVVGNVYKAITGTSTYRRPGMPSVIKLSDGNYAMIVEHNGANENDYWMRVAISYSHDLTSWTAPQAIIYPKYSGVYYDGIKYLCGAPYIQLLKDGRIAVSFTTNDTYVNTLGVGDSGYYKTVELAISDGAVSYGDAPTMIRQDAISYNNDTGARYGGCKVVDDKIILIANEYNFTEEEGKNNYRYVARGTVFSTATYY